jgi:hypothetical protein
MKPTRRKVLTYGLVLAGGATTGLGLSRGLPSGSEYKIETEAVIAAIEDVSEGPIPKESIKLYDGSRTLHLFIPDVHDEEIIRYNRARIIMLQSALSNHNQTIVAGGLEGIFYGRKEQEALGRLKKSADKETEKWIQKVRDLKEDLVSVRISSGNFLDILTQGPSEMNQIERALLFGMSWDYNFNRFDLREAEIGRTNAPGLEYFDLFPEVFGLESKYIDEISAGLMSYNEMRVAYFAVEQALERFNGLNIPESESQYRVKKELEVTARNLKAHIAEAETKIPKGYLGDQIHPIQKEAVNLDIFDPEMYAGISFMDPEAKRIVVNERSRAWIGNVPKDIEGIVMIVGGISHIESYKTEADFAKQSYIIVPVK